MNVRGLLIATVLLAALAGGLWYSNKYEREKEGQPAADAPPKILELPEDQIRKVEIRRRDGDATVVEKTENQWRLTAPRQLAADPDTVTPLLSTLSSLTSDRLVEEKASNLAEFGLDKPSVEVVVTLKDGKSHKVLFGDETPTGGGFFVRVDNDPRVFTVASLSKTNVDKNTNDLRDKRLLIFDSDKVSRVELTAKGQTIEFGKNNQNEWQIVKPRPARADGFAVEELTRKLRDAKMDPSISEDDAKKAAASFASGKLLGVAKVTDAGATHQIEVRQKDTDYFAKSSAVEGVHKVTGELGEGLNKSVDDFRNKKLFEFGFNDPTRIEFRNAATTRVFQKSGENWMSDGKQMDSTSVQAFVDRLRDLAAEKFPEQGFTTAAVEIAITSNDGKRVEKVQIAKAGDNYIARRDNEMALYELSGSSVDELVRLAGEVKAAPPAAKK